MFHELSGSQKEILAHIEFVARFYGLVSRLDLTSRFEISDASATRMFRLYNDLAPDNIIYRPNLKRYEWQESAMPIVPMSTFKCVSTLTDGFGDSYAHTEGEAIATRNSLTTADLDILSVITRAIKRKQVLTICYLSKTSPKGTYRDIVPHSIADSGLRWHVRAYDRNRQNFIDFVVNRIKSAAPAKRECIPECQTIKADEAWNTFIELKIQPHPRLKDIKNVIEFEYRMSSGILTCRVRKALAGYLLDSWNVDVTDDASLIGDHIMLHLKNTKDLSFKNKILAPGARC
ncbi:WYL domain-containing protein [Pseudidiomarina sp. 1APP75-27a]|uniref:WYL domain-containing protein n=1 Tax=Pseudidiomarina terrestris TaxID=2820060 RepID=UPI002B053921|nr:WYL domain-containing protein [Pseudidiomarina sp. 1APP75-27a]MEA3588412.1 WYL domain-containing protein [Pseudidiomarina sp. 1APP75-27a]